MGERRLAFIAGITFVAALASPAFAEPDEIEMDATPVAPTPTPTPRPKPPTPPQPKPPTPTPQPTPTPTADGPVKKDVATMRRFHYAAQQLVQRGDYFVKVLKKPEEAKKEYENAVIAYGKAIEAGDDLILPVELATLLDKLGKFDEAARMLRKVVATTDAKPDVVKKAQTKLDEVAAKIGIVTLTVKPEGSLVTMDGKELGKAPVETLVLMPGTYNVAVTMEGFQPKEAELKVEAGSESERTIELEEVKVIIEMPKPKPVDVDLPPPPQKPSKLPLYLGAGATAGFLTVGVVTGILAVGQHGAFVSPEANATERADAKASGRTLAKVTDAMLIGTVVAGGFTAYWYFMKYKKAGPAKPKDERRPRGPDPELSKLDIAPWVQHDAGGFVVAGSF